LKLFQHVPLCFYPRIIRFSELSIFILDNYSLFLKRKSNEKVKIKEFRYFSIWIKLRKAPRELKIPSELLPGHLLGTSPHYSLQKVTGINE